MRFLLIFAIVVLIAGCGGDESSMINLDDTNSLDNQLVEEFNKQMSMTWVPDVAPITRFDEETRILYWCLRGDYDLSGEVNISDITSIAQNYNQEVDEEVNPSLVEGAPWWVDGNSDGWITINDITPIAQNFQERAFWWKTSIGWGKPLGGLGGLFYIVVPENIEAEDIVLKISSEPQPVEVSENVAPIAILQADPVFGLLPLEVVFDVSASIDLDGEIVMYELDWDGDGIYDCGSSYAAIASHTYEVVSAYNVKLRVTDDDGSVGVDNQLIMVAELDNLPPVAALSVSPISGIVPITITLDASESHDSDGHIVTTEWDLDGNGTWDMTSVGPGSTLPRHRSYTKAGIYVPRIRVTDNEGAKSIAVGSMIILEAPENLPPTASLIASPTSGYAPLEVYFDASASFDQDGSVVRYNYDFDEDGIWDAYDVGNTVSWTYTEAGFFRALVQITDNDGAQNTGLVNVSVNILGNELPVADLIANPTSGDAPLAVYFDASASYDLDGSVVRYDYDFNNDGIWDAYDSSPVVSWMYTSAGVYTAKVRVTDDDGAQDIASVEIDVNVLGNESPIADVTADPTDGYAPLEVNFDAFASFDPDGNIVRYDYDFNNNGIWDAYDSEGAVTWTFLNSGVFTSIVRVTDDDGAQDTDSVEITVNDSGGGGDENGPGDWAMFGREPTHNSRSPFYGPQTGTLSWRYLTGGYVHSSPAIGADGTIYVGSFDGFLYALNPNGSLHWRIQTGGAMYSSPAIGADGTLYVGTHYGYLYSISSEGTLNWRYKAGDADMRSSPVLGADGTIYVGCGDWYLYAINPDGTLKWRYQTGDDITSSPALDADGVIYVGSYDDYLYAINSDGTLKWRYLTGGSINSSPAIRDDGTVFVGCHDYYVYAVNSDGTLNWRYLTGGPIGSSPAVGIDGSVYIGSNDNYLYALTSEGSLSVRYMTYGNILSSPTLGSDGTIYVGSADQNIYALSFGTGIKWQYLASPYGTINSSPAIGSDGTLYVGGYDSFLYAFHD